MHYGKLPKETKFEKSIADRIKSRKERLDIINKNKENINNELFKEYFDYSNPRNYDQKIKRCMWWKKLKYGKINQQESK